MFLSRAGVEQTHSTFWSVTQSLFDGIQITIPPLKEEHPETPYDPTSLNISGVIRELELDSTLRPIAPGTMVFSLSV